MRYIEKLKGGTRPPFFMVENMSVDLTVVAQMRQLIQLLAKHNHAYYVMDQPTIADSEYDQLFHQLKALEATVSRFSTTRYTDQ